MTDKKKMILLVLLLSIIAFVTTMFFKKDKPKIDPVIEEIVDEVNTNTPEDSDPVIYGLDIKNKYNEVNGADFAVLITTTNLLEGLDNNESEDNYKYIVNENDTNTISEIKDTNGNYMDAVVVNYNRLLKDSVVTKDISGGYITPYGFTGEGDKKFNKYKSNKSIKIDNNSIFSEAPIYDSNYKEIGVLYIEINKNNK
jgi:hypothetical protein